MRRLAALSFLLTALVLAGCGGGDGDNGADAGGQQTEEPAQEAQPIEISGTDFELTPATVDLPGPGSYTFVFTNDGQSPHALEIDGHGVEEETETIGPGETAELTVELTEAGEYEMYCPVGNHREMGMEGSVVVGGSAAGGAGTHTEGTTTDETTTQEDSGYGYG